MIVELPQRYVGIFTINRLLSNNPEGLLAVMITLFIFDDFKHGNSRG